MAVVDKIKNLLPRRSSGESLPSAQSGSGINRKAVLVGVLLLLFVLAMAAMFTIESGEARKNKIYSTIASEQQVISQQIAVNALEASAGQDRAFDSLAANQGRFLANLEKYNNGDLAQALPALPEHFSVEYANLKAVWNDYDRHIATVVAAKNSIATVSDYVTQINESLPELISLSDSVVTELVNSNAPRANIAVAARR